MKNISIIGAGAMGSGIAQVALMHQCNVVMYDTNDLALERGKNNIEKSLNKLQEKGKIDDAQILLNNLKTTTNLQDTQSSELIIEAIIENLEIKKKLFTDLESIVSSDCILASNTSSLSITSIAAACKLPSRCIGIHFFNPAPIMALVEIIPAIQTDANVVTIAQSVIDSWGKKTVIAKDTPGFIVNRIARPFYSEAIKIMEEGLATQSEIDHVMKTNAGFRMGPFELMDYIGHDVNYVVTETVFQAFFYDNRYKPSFSQKRLLEAGWLGKKSGRGFYNYSETPTPVEINISEERSKIITERIVALLINEAVDALFLNVASAKDIETSMKFGVNYPKGLLEWCNEWSAKKTLEIIDDLYHTYHDEKYRASPLLRQLASKDEIIKI